MVLESEVTNLCSCERNPTSCIEHIASFCPFSRSVRRTRHNPILMPAEVAPFLEACQEQWSDIVLQTYCQRTWNITSTVLSLIRRRVLYCVSQAWSLFFRVSKELYKTLKNGGATAK